VNCSPVYLTNCGASCLCLCGLDLDSTSDVKASKSLREAGVQVRQAVSTATATLFADPVVGDGLHPLQRCVGAQLVF
jgi:hypothetical protein